MARTRRQPDEPEFDPEELFELASAPSIFLEMRSQNIELLKIAMQLAERIPPAGGASNDPRAAMEHLWGLFAELYDWIDPEQSEDEDE